MTSIVLGMLHIVGTATILILISYLFVDMMKRKKGTLTDVVSHTLVLVILFFILLRT